MASQGPNSTFNASQAPGQAQESVAHLQMRRDDQPSDVHNQGSLLEETGTQVKNMAQGAADIAAGTAQGAVNLARGAATGAANMASGAADAVKNTLGINPADNTTNTTTTTNNATSRPTNLGGTAGVTNPTSIGHPSNPSTRI